MSEPFDKAPERCDYCGALDWTLAKYEVGRILHKHNCPHRTDSACQTHPNGCLSDVEALVEMVREALLPPYSGGKVWEGVGPTPRMEALDALASIEKRLRFSRTFASIEDLEDSLRAEQERDGYYEQSNAQANEAGGWRARGEAAEQRVKELEEALRESEEYAKEGWIWLDKALAALGVSTVFDIPASAKDKS